MTMSDELPQQNHSTADICSVLRVKLKSPGEIVLGSD